MSTKPTQILTHVLYIGIIALSGYMHVAQYDRYKQLVEAYAKPIKRLPIIAFTELCSTHEGLNKVVRLEEKIFNVSCMDNAVYQRVKMDFKEKPAMTKEQLSSIDRMVSALP